MPALMRLSSISIVSDFSYVGECSYGMVYSYHDLINDTLLLIMPTYCGYWLTTPCNSIDTFKIGTLPVGNYALRIEYHQGSVCPISGFDATIDTFDMVLTVTQSTDVPLPVNTKSIFSIYPNPADNQIIIDLLNAEPLTGYQLNITNLNGQTVFQSPINQQQFHVDTSTWRTGMYVVSIIDLQGNAVEKRKIVIQ